jgi:hypothetical protein
LTYYRVEFMDSPASTARVKRFRTAESARNHAKRVLGVVDESALASKVAILAVSRKGSPEERVGERGTV